jgi:hypothetical protein
LGWSWSGAGDTVDAVMVFALDVKINALLMMRLARSSQHASRALKA